MAEYKSEVMDHLGLVAGMYDELGIGIAGMFPNVEVLFKTMYY